MGRGGLGEERESFWPCRLIQCPENCSSPLELPFLQSALLYFLDSLLRAPLMWGNSKQTLNRTRLKACRGNTHLLCFLKGFIFFLQLLPSCHLPAECEEGLSATHQFIFITTIQPHSPSLILYFFCFLFLIVCLLFVHFLLFGYFRLFCCRLFCLSVIFVHSFFLFV